MNAEYFPEVDMLTIAFIEKPYKQEDVLDTDDPNVLLLYDEKGQLAEIEISHASTRVNLEEMRRKISFEEMRLENAEAASARAVG